MMSFIHIAVALCQSLGHGACDEGKRSRVMKEAFAQVIYQQMGTAKSVMGSRLLMLQ